MRVSQEDREKAIVQLEAAFKGNPPHGHETWPEAAYDTMVALGWGPGGGCARPTREALKPILVKEFRAAGLNLDGEPWVRDGNDQWPVAQQLLDRVLDALLAADHLWTEQPATEYIDGGEDQSAMVLLVEAIRIVGAWAQRNEDANEALNLLTEVRDSIVQKMSPADEAELLRRLV